MPNVLQILSKNYSGESVNITFTPLKGSPQKFENVSLPYNFINDTFEGNYTLFFPDYNLTHKFTYPDVIPLNNCRCTEFSCFSFIGRPCKVGYKTCKGVTRSVSLLSGQSHRDCVLANSVKTSKGVRTTAYNYCTVLSDCIELSQPPTPQPTRTPTRTPASTTTPTSTPTVTKTSTPTVTSTKTPTKTSTPTNTLTQTSTVTSTQTPTVTQTSTPTNTLTPTLTSSVTQTNTPTTTQTPTVTTPVNCPFILINQYLGGYGFRPTGIYLYDSVTNIASPITVNGFDVNLLDQLPEYCSSSSLQCSGTTGSAHYYDVNTQTGKLWIKNRLDLLYEFDLGVNYEATFVTQYNCPGRFLTLKNNTTLITLTGYGNSSNVRLVEIDVSSPSLVLTPKFNLSTNVTTNSQMRDLGSLLYTNNGKLLVVARINGSDSQIQQYDYESGNLEYLGPIINNSPITVPPPYQWIPDSHSMLVSQNRLWLCNLLHFRTWIDATSGYPLVASPSNQFMWINTIGAGPGQTTFPIRIDRLLGISPNSLTCNYFSFTPNVNLSPTPTQTNTPTPTITPSITQTNTPTQSFTPSVTQTNTPTITQTITPTSLCRCVTITNLLGSANTITYQFCGYVEIGPVLIEYELEPNEVLRDCMINESVTGDNILVSYDGGTCILVGNQRICPELPISPTPTITPTITQTVTPSSPINQNIIISSGRKIFPDGTSQQGLFKYDYDLNTMTYLNISGNYAGVSHSYNFQTQTGKIWASNGGVIQEYNILNSNLDNELNRTIVLTGSAYGRNLTFKNDNTLIKTILVNGERWVAEIDITETNVSPITNLKFRITSTDSNDDTFTTDLMYTNTGKFIWTNRFPNVVLQQYDYETGALEFESPVSLQPASLFQINSQIISIQTAPVRVVYDLVTADDTLICPNILCGPTTGPTTLPGCIGQNCNLYNFESNGASSLLINNSVNFVPNQVCPIVDDFVVSQDFGTILVQNNTEYDLNVFTKTSTTLIGTVLSGQLGQFPETSFEESTVGVVPTYLEYFSTCRVCKDVFNAYIDCETGCGTLDGLQMSKTDEGETLLVTNNSTSRLYFYDSVDSLFPVFEVGANTGTNVSPSSDFQYGIIVIGVIKINGVTCKTCFSLDTLLEISCPIFNNKLIYFDNNGLSLYNISNQSFSSVIGYPQDETYDGVAFNANYLYVLNKNESILKRYDIINSSSFEISPSSVLVFELPDLFWVGTLSLSGPNKILIPSQVVQVAYVIYEIINNELVEVDRVFESVGETSRLAVITETNPKREIIFGPSFRQSVNYSEDKYYGEISGIYSVSQLFNVFLVGVFFHDWQDGDGVSINLVVNNGEILKINKNYPYNCTLVSNLPSNTIKSASQVYGFSEYNSYFNPPIYLSGLTSGIVYSLANNSLPLTVGQFVSGLTYNKSIKNFNSIYKSVNINGAALPNSETKFKVVDFNQLQSNKYWRYWDNIISLAVVSGYTNQNNYQPINYNLQQIFDSSPEIFENFNGVLKIKIDVSKFVWDLRLTDEHIFGRVNEIVEKIESLPIISNLDFTIQCDVEYWTTNTIFDNISITNYQNYYENLGGIFTYSGHHFAIVWNNLTSSAGVTNTNGGFYIQIGGSNSNIVNNVEIWDTFVHEVGHALSLIHTFDCYWKDIYQDLEYEYLDNTNDETYGCLNCGYYTPYINEYLGTESEGYLAIMGYGKFNTGGCSSPNYAQNSLETNERIFNSSSSTNFGDNNDKNITYYNFLEDNEIIPNDLNYIIFTIGNSGSSNLDNIIDSISIISVGGNETVIIPQRSSSPNVITLTLNFSDISQVFNYNEQSKFGIKLNRQKINDGTTNWILTNGMNISFFNISGNNILSRKPKNYFTIHNGESIQVPILFTNRASRLNSYESNLVNIYTKFVSRSYFNL